MVNKDVSVLKEVFQSGSVRVDLVGGTLDLRPLNLIIPNVVTVNMATGLKAKVNLSRLAKSSSDNAQYIIESKDYQQIYRLNQEEFDQMKGDESAPLRFVLLIIDQFFRLPEVRKNIAFDEAESLRVLLESDAPAGSGLGGSSAMGATLLKGLFKLYELDPCPERIISIVNNLEGVILNRGPAGYQDYYPAMYGGLLALVSKAYGIEVEQYYDEEFCRDLCQHLTLVSSDISRNSGINNWEVYKSFFDDDGKTRIGLHSIAKASFDLYQGLKSKNLNAVLENICLEGEIRENLFHGIVPQEVRELYLELRKQNLVKGMKVCGAGGGGCFLLVHSSAQKASIEKVVNSHKMRCLDLTIEKALV